jgi:hypothetical protein
VFIGSLRESTLDSLPRVRSRFAGGVHDLLAEPANFIWIQFKPALRYLVYIRSGSNGSFMLTFCFSSFRCT